MDWTDITIRVPTQSARASVATTRTFRARGLQFKAKVLAALCLTLPATFAPNGVAADVHDQWSWQSPHGTRHRIDFVAVPLECAESVVEA